MRQRALDDTAPVAPVTRIMAAPRPPKARRGWWDDPVLRALVYVGAVLADVGLAAIAFAAVKVAVYLLRMNG